MTTLKNDSSQKLINKLNELNQYKIDLGLDRLLTALQRLELNQYKPTYITVGGTNGKGSTVAAICSLLSTQNVTYGAFTSPHIFKFNERININGRSAKDDEILAAFTRIDKARGDIELSYFEYAFLAALLIFQQHELDVVVLEVGLGGRLDAANVIDADAAIITTVDVDHTEWLGDDIETIAKEKAGIMRANQPVIYGDEATPNAIKIHAEKLGANLVEYGTVYQTDKTDDSFSYQFNQHQFANLPLPSIPGDWQVKNFASALSALLSLGFEYSEKQIQNSLTQWTIPARLQTIQSQPLVLADVAHNKQAVENLAQWLKAHPVNGHTRAVFSVLADKQPGDWLGLMDECVDHWFIFELDSQRAMKLNDLKLTLADNVSLISQFNSAKQAYEMALLNSKPNDRVIVFGSFHVLEGVFDEN